MNEPNKTEPAHDYCPELGSQSRPYGCGCTDADASGRRHYCEVHAHERIAALTFDLAQETGLRMAFERAAWELAP